MQMTEHALDKSQHLAQRGRPLEQWTDIVRQECYAIFALRPEGGAV